MVLSGPRRRAVLAILPLLGAVGLIVTLLWNQGSTGNQDSAVLFDAIASIITAAITASAVIYAAASLHVTVHRDRQGRAFALLAELNSRDLYDALIHCIELTDSETPNTLLYRLNNDHGERHKVWLVLSHLEDIAIAIEEDHAEEQVLFRSLHRLVPRLWKAFCPFILAERRRLGGDTLFVELELMAKWWDQSESLRDHRYLSRTGRIRTLG